MNETAAAQARQLARTINLGIDFGSHLERGWTVAVSNRHLDACAQAGFTAVRLGVCWACHPTLDATYGVDDRVVEQVAGIVDDARARGLSVVIANRHDPELLQNPPRHRARLLAQLAWVASAFRDQPSSVMLEPLADARGDLGAAWNTYVADLIETARGIDRTRTLVIGPRSADARFLGHLSLPRDDRNVIVAIHHYWPFTFTMQGETAPNPARWGNPSSWIGTSWDDSPVECDALATAFDAIAHWATTHNRPIFISEFGATAHADMASRVRWTRYSRELAERRGFSWGYWSFAPSFGLYDLGRDRWHEELLGALLPRGEDTELPFTD